MNKKKKNIITAIVLVLFMIFLFATFDRCDLPTAAFRRTLCDHPGRLAVGPEEKNGEIGLIAGFVCGVIASSRSYVTTGWEIATHIMDRKNTIWCQQTKNPFQENYQLNIFSTIFTNPPALYEKLMHRLSYPLPPHCQLQP